jgi:serine/threonine protein kinase
MEWPRIPGYQIEARIGAGGMAVVFRARDERLRRPVALKILASALAADDGFRRRFIREARAAAMVDDPHIIPVFEAGESDGLPFIAMRFVATVISNRRHGSMCKGSRGAWPLGAYEARISALYGGPVKRPLPRRSW